jgi:hypothetical protein
MAVLSSRRIPGLIGVLAAGLALLAPTSASAQIPAGSLATPLVGSGIVAECPPGVAADLAPGTATINGVTVGFPAAGRCTPLAADAEGSYTVAGSFDNPLPFTSECANTDGIVTSRSGVTVPAGTIVNGVAVAQPTVVETPNAAVVFPGGRTAILNQRIETPTSVTQNAIVFAGGPIVGQVICGAAAYPLAVGSASGASDVTPELAGAPVSSGGDGGPSTVLLLVGAVIALALVAQVAVGRRMWQGRNSAGAAG